MKTADAQIIALLKEIDAGGGGSGFNSSGTYPSLTAGKATTIDGVGEDGDILYFGTPPTWAGPPIPGDASLNRNVLDFTSTTIPEPLGGTLTLAVGSIHTSTSGATLTTVAFSGDPDTAKPATILRLNVTNGPIKINIPVCYRLGQISSISSIVLSNGRHELSWVYAEGAYWMADSVTADQLVLVPSDLSGDTVASASTLNLTTTYDKQLDITGTTPINAITMDEGDQRLLVFKGVTTLTQGASLLLPGGFSRTTSAGDWAVVQGGAGGVVTVLHYQDVDGYKTNTFDKIYLLAGAKVGFGDVDAPYFDVGRSVTADNPDSPFLRFTQGDDHVALSRTDLGAKAMLNIALLSVNRQFQFPDKAGTFAMLDDISTLGMAYAGATTEDVATTSTDGTADDIFTYPSSGAQVGGYVYSRQTITTVGSATATRRIELYFNGLLIWDSGTVTLALGGTFIIDVTILHATSHGYKASVSVAATSASTVPYATYTEINDADFLLTEWKTKAVATGTGAASGDIIMRSAIVGTHSN